MELTKELYTLKEVAVVLGFSYETLKSWRKKNKINVVVIGRSVRVTKEEIERIKRGV